MTGVEIIQIVLGIWGVAFLAILAVAIRNLTTAVDYHTRAVYRVASLMEPHDDY